MNCIEISLSKIRPTPDSREGKPDVKTLAASIKTVGMLNPILLRERDDETYDLVAGHRRLAAAQKLKWVTIPAHIIRTDTPEIVAVVENVERKQLDPFEEADAFVALAASHPIKNIAATFGVKEHYVHQRMQLHGVIPEIRELYRKGEDDWTLRACQRLAIYPADEQRTWAEEGQPPYDHLLSSQQIPMARARFEVPDDLPIGHDLFGEDGPVCLDPERFKVLQAGAFHALIAKHKDAKLTVFALVPGDYPAWRYRSSQPENQCERDKAAGVVVELCHDLAITERFLTKEATRTIEAMALREDSPTAQRGMDELTGAIGKTGKADEVTGAFLEMAGKWAMLAQLNELAGLDASAAIVAGCIYFDQHMRGTGLDAFLDVYAHDWKEVAPYYARARATKGLTKCTDLVLRLGSNIQADLATTKKLHFLLNTLTPVMWTMPPQLLEKLPADWLRRACSTHNLPTGGKKSEIVARLWEKGRELLAEGEQGILHEKILALYTHDQDPADVQEDAGEEYDPETGEVSTFTVDDDMDGDHESAFASAGMGVDESYGNSDNPI